MTTLFEQQTLWLNIANIALGLVTVVCCGLLGISVLRELVAKWREKTHPVYLFDDHTFTGSELGTTMADGGERVDQTSS